MDRLMAKGEVPEEEMKELEKDVTGKLLLASWRGTRFEVVQVLREVSLNAFEGPNSRPDHILPSRWLTMS